MSQQKILNHITSRIKADVEFLVAEGLMSRYDADQVVGKLPAAAIDAPMNRMGLSTPVSSAAGTPSPARETPPPLRRLAPPAPTPATVTPQAKSLWGYNEDGSEPDDLSFPAGVAIDIIEETNADWWKGRYDGREGIFPSSFVEKLSNTPTPAPAPSFPAPTPAPSDPEKAGFAARANNGPRFTAPPPPGGRFVPPPPMQNQWNGAPPTQNQNHWNNTAQPSPQNQWQDGAQPQGVPEKKSKFGKYGKQAGTAAVGGVGFGAGAAIGSGIINAIF